MANKFFKYGNGNRIKAAFLAHTICKGVDISDFNCFPAQNIAPENISLDYQ